MSTRKNNKKKSRRSKTHSTPAERADVKKEVNPQIEELWKIFNKAKPEQRERIIKELDEDTVTELRKRGNPYRKSALYKKQKGKRILLCSIFSPLEKYIDRFSMTSLIGFMFRMLDEYTPIEAKQYLSEDDPKFGNLYHEISEAFKKDKPIQVTQYTIDALEQKLDSIDAEIAKFDKKKQDQAAEEDEGISEDEEDVDAEETLRKERVNVSRELDETYAKQVIHAISTLKQEISALRPALVSLEKDLFRQKNMRKAIKDKLRMLLKEKEKSEKHADYTAKKEAVDDETPVIEEVDEHAEPEADALGEANVSEAETDDNIAVDEDEDVEVIAAEAEAAADAEAVTEAEITPAVDAEVDEMVEEMKKTAKEVAQEKLAQRSRKKKKKKPVRLRDMEVILKELRIYKGKLASSTESVEIAQTKYDNHMAKIEELTTQHEAELESILKMQKDYYEKWGSPTEKAHKKNAKSKSKKNKKSKKTGRTGPSTAFDHMTFEECEMTDEDEFFIKEEVKEQLGIKWTQEEKSDHILDSIEEFMYEYLVFNPDNHVRSGYRPNYKDPTRTPLKRDPESGMIIEETWERKLVPPEDTFKRWERYREAHYEQLRQATDDIYAEKSDFEWVIVPHESFEGENAQENAAEWERKHSKEVDYSVRSVTYNENNLLGPWEQNREATNFYTKETEIIKRMLDAKKDDERIGKDLMKDRVRKKKEENEEELGADAGLDEYLNRNPGGLEQYGAKRVLQNTKNDSNVPHDEQDLADDEVQIDVIRLGAERKGRRFKATANNWKFHLPAKPLKEGEVLTHTPSDFQKSVLKAGTKE
jgi:hypothetical protein